jgi:hypothetical protein
MQKSGFEPRGSTFSWAANPSFFTACECLKIVNDFSTTAKNVEFLTKLRNFH